MAKKQRKKVMLTSFSIILIIIFVLGIVSHLLPEATFINDEIVNGSGVVGLQFVGGFHRSKSLRYYETYSQ